MRVPRRLQRPRLHERRVAERDSDSGHRGRRGGRIGRAGRRRGAGAEQHSRQRKHVCKRICKLFC